MSDLEEAITVSWDAVDLTPDGHPDKPGCLNNLGNSFRTRFERLGESSDLEEAISWQRNAVDLAPDGHPGKSAVLNNLGNSFITRFEHFKELSDLEEAISRQRNATDLAPDGHPEKPAHLSNLGGSLRTRFEHLGELSDLEEAISRQRDAVDLTPDGHLDKSTHLSNCGKSFLARFERTGERSDLEEAVSLFSHAACDSAGHIVVRFDAPRQWISCARLLRHHSLLQAYFTAVALLPQLAWIGLSLAHRYLELTQAADVVREAAAAALEFGHREIAVEWLEQGRSIVWGELFQLRSSYDELSSAYPDYARRLRELSAALEHASVSREKSLFSRLEQAHSSGHHTMPSLQQEVEKHRGVAIARDKLLQDIRGLPGFERFLLRTEFSQLRASAHPGPVVFINAAETRCDALIVLANVDHVIHIPLSRFTLARSRELHVSLNNLVRHAREIPNDDRYGRPVPQEGVGPWNPMLASLWKCVVKPVLDALAFSVRVFLHLTTQLFICVFKQTPGELSRIFWCPTGPFTFLPIHAAGFYDPRFSEPGHKVFDFVVSSYIPTLRILVPSPGSEAVTRDGLRFLAVPQPLSDGQVPLSGVKAEMEHTRAIIGNSSSAQITLTEPSVGTVEEVLDLMKGADWVHFACHGVQDEINPTESGLCLANERRLRISDIIALSRPRGGLAFLSACHTAKGDDDLSDEAVHISAGMLFAGYGGVIGTMWAIKDNIAPDVARDVYEQLFQYGTTPDYREAARALQDAVGRLRSRQVPFDHWLPFIHVGL